MTFVTYNSELKNLLVSVHPSICYPYFTEPKRTEFVGNVIHTLPDFDCEILRYYSLFFI